MKAEAVRVTLVVTLTHAASYRITQPAPNRVSVDLERADFDFERPVDLKANDGWVTDWSYGYLIFGYTRLSVYFVRNVSVVRDEMRPAAATEGFAELSIDIAESP